MNVGLIAHDAKKMLMQNLCIAYQDILRRHTLYATATTGKVIEEVTNLTIHKLQVGHFGGMHQIGALIENNEMDLLINELTFYSKIDTNRIPYNFTTISAKQYFGDCAEDLFMELEAKGVQFRYRNYLETDSKVIVDPEQLRRVISNIVGNSVKYMDKSDPSITMDLKDVGDFVQIELGDNGKGIAAKDLPNIFDRFYRTDASRNSSKGGSGIGLSIVKKIVEEHGGKIWATSEEGVGTTMYFVIRKYQEVPMNE